MSTEVVCVSEVVPSPFLDRDSFTSLLYYRSDPSRALLGVHGSYRPTNTCLSSCVRVCTCVHLPVHVCVYGYVYERVHTTVWYVSAHVCVPMCASYLYTCVWVCVCERMNLCVKCTYVCVSVSVGRTTCGSGFLSLRVTVHVTVLEQGSRVRFRGSFVTPSFFTYLYQLVRDQEVPTTSNPSSRGR